MNLPEFKYAPTGAPIYCINPEIKVSEIDDLISARLLQLNALLSVVTGDGVETFHNYNDMTKEYFLWACLNMVSEVEELFKQFSARVNHS